MADYEEEVLATLKGILNELVAARKEREVLRREEEDSAENLHKQLAAEKEARRREHEAYLATVQSDPCEGSPQSNHSRPY